MTENEPTSDELDRRLSELGAQLPSGVPPLSDVLVRSRARTRMVRTRALVSTAVVVAASGLVLGVLWRGSPETSTVRTDVRRGVGPEQGHGSFSAVFDERGHVSSDGTSTLNLGQLDGSSIELSMTGPALARMRSTNLVLRANAQCPIGTICGYADISAYPRALETGTGAGQQPALNGATVEMSGAFTVLRFRTARWVVDVYTFNIPPTSYSAWTSGLSVTDVAGWPVITSTGSAAPRLSRASPTLDATSRRGGIIDIHPATTCTSAIDEARSVTGRGSPYKYASQCSEDQRGMLSVQGPPRFVDEILDGLSITRKA